jgi:plastocyanin
MTRTSIGLVACTAALILAGAACGTDSRPKPMSAGAANDSAAGTAAQPSAPAGDTISIKLIAFAPTRIEVPAGGTVTWRQDDVAAHTVTSGPVEQAGGTVTARPDGRFDSGTITKGQNFRFTFTEPGEYPFFCAIHPATMTGVVTVK